MIIYVTICFDNRGKAFAFDACKSMSAAKYRCWLHAKSYLDKVQRVTDFDVVFELKAFQGLLDSDFELEDINKYIKLEHLSGYRKQYAISKVDTATIDQT